MWREKSIVHVVLDISVELRKAWVQFRCQAEQQHVLFKGSQPEKTNQHINRQRSSCVFQRQSLLSSFLPHFEDRLADGKCF